MQWVIHDNVDDPLQKPWTPKLGESPWLTTLCELSHIKARRTGAIRTTPQGGGDTFTPPGPHPSHLFLLTATNWNPEGSGSAAF